MTIEIKNRYTGAVICTGETVREAAVANFSRLVGAYLVGAYLRGANLRGAYLVGADLRGADLVGADLGSPGDSAILAWQSHDLLAEILRRAAGGDIEKLKVAGFVLLQRGWCWKEFARLAAVDPLGEWALMTLAEWVQPGDGAPECLRIRKERIDAAT